MCDFFENLVRKMWKILIFWCEKCEKCEKFQKFCVRKMWSTHILFRSSLLINYQFSRPIQLAYFRFEHQKIKSCTTELDMKFGKFFLKIFLTFYSRVNVFHGAFEYFFSSNRITVGTFHTKGWTIFFSVQIFTFWD
jgi:hypothetical protein